MPLYNQDLETADPPAAWTQFRNRVRMRCDSLRHAGEQPRRARGAEERGRRGIGPGKEHLGRQARRIVSASAGPLGGFGANHQLRQNLSYFAMLLLQQPEMYLGGVDKLVGPGGKVTDDKARELFTAYLTAFASWVERSLIRKG